MMKKAMNHRLTSILALAMTVGGTALLQVGCVKAAQADERVGEESVAPEAESPVAPGAASDTNKIDDSQSFNEDATAAQQALAFASTPFSFDEGTGRTSGGLTWLNRSVGTQGQICDTVFNGFTQVVFEYYLRPGAQGEQFGAPETRTIEAAPGTPGGELCKPFSFTKAGPAGGIRSAIVLLCDDEGFCEEGGIFNRPGA